MVPGGGCVLRPAFTSKAMDQGASWNGVTLDFSRPGKPTDNGLRQEPCLAG